MTGGAILLLGLVEGVASVVPFDPGPFGFAALAGFLLLTVWMIWTGLLCILRPAKDGWPDRPADPRPERTLSLRSRRDHPPR